MCPLAAPWAHILVFGAPCLLPLHPLFLPRRPLPQFGTMSGGLPHKPLRPMDLTKSMDLLPKLDGAPLPDWAKKSGSRGLKKSDSGPSLPGSLGACLWAARVHPM